MMKCKGHACWLSSLLAMVVLSAMVGFSGCSSTGVTSTTPTGTVTTPAPIIDQAAAQRAVYEAKETYGIAVQAATVYAQLPRCSATQGAPCSDQAKVDQIIKARNAAREALAAAQAAVDSTNFGANIYSTAAAAVTAAMSALTAAVPAIAAKPTVITP